MTRAEFTKLVIDAAGVDLAQSSELSNCFSDVSDVSTQWYAAHACAAKKIGVISGVNGAFLADQSIKQAEALKIILATFGLEIKADDTATAWYAPIQTAALDHNLLSASLRFEPAKALTRAEVAALVSKAISQ